MNTPSRRSFFKGTSLLGLRPIVNASGTYTHLGGSLKPPEVLEAMNDAARHYVPIPDLTKRPASRSPDSPASRAPW